MGNRSIKSTNSFAIVLTKHGFSFWKSCAETTHRKSLKCLPLVRSKTYWHITASAWLHLLKPRQKEIRSLRGFLVGCGKTLCQRKSGPAFKPYGIAEAGMVTKMYNIPVKPRLSVAWTCRKRHAIYFER